MNTMKQNLRKGEVVYGPMILERLRCEIWKRPKRGPVISVS